MLIVTSIDFLFDVIIAGVANAMPRFGVVAIAIAIIDVSCLHACVCVSFGDGRWSTCHFWTCVIAVDWF